MVVMKPSITIQRMKIFSLFHYFLGPRSFKIPIFHYQFWVLCINQYLPMLDENGGSVQETGIIVFITNQSNCNTLKNDILLGSIFFASYISRDSNISSPFLSTALYMIYLMWQIQKGISLQKTGSSPIVMNQSN